MVVIAPQLQCELDKSGVVAHTYSSSCSGDWREDCLSSAIQGQPRENSDTPISKNKNVKLQKFIFSYIPYNTTHSSIMTLMCFILDFLCCDFSLYKGHWPLVDYLNLYQRNNSGQNRTFLYFLCSSIRHSPPTHQHSCWSLYTLILFLLQNFCTGAFLWLECSSSACLSPSILWGFLSKSPPLEVLLEHCLSPQNHFIYWTLVQFSFPHLAICY